MHRGRTGALALALATALVSTVTSSHTYNGFSVSDSIWDAIHDASVAEIIQGATSAASMDCSVSFQTKSPLKEAWASHSLQAFPVHIGSRASTQLPRYVSDPGTAQWACYALWPCARVDLYNAPAVGPGLLQALYFTLPEGQDNFTTVGPGAGAEGNPAPPPTSAWNSSVSVSRGLGLGCPAGATSPDPVFLYETYIGHGTGARFEALVAAGALPPLGSLGLDSVLGASPGAVSAAGDALKWAYITQGHLAHLWPNGACPMTPMARDPGTGCSRARCPLFTLCPAGARVNAATWGTCFPNPLTSSPSGPEVLLPEDPLSISLAAGTLTFGPTPAFPGTPAMTLFALAAVEATQGGPVLLPCGAQAGRGFCSHFSPAAGVVGPGTPICACSAETGGAPHVTGDVACQLSPTPCLPPDTGSASGTGDGPGPVPCSGHGVCALDRASVLWTFVDPTAPEARAVACLCTPPWTGPLCNTTLCAAPGSQQDCQTAGTGVCALAPSLGSGVWACTCNPPLYGPACEFTDVQTGASDDLDVASDVAAALAVAAAGPQYGCYIREDQVGSPGPGVARGDWLLCSGRGTCTPSPSAGGNATSKGSCTCASGWTGARCEYPACDHKRDCGAYGRCLATVTDRGRALMTCACLVHAQDAGLALAETPPGSSRCDVSLCPGGTLVTTWPPPADPDTDMGTRPRGVCRCRDTVSDPVAELGTLAPGPPLTYTDRWGNGFTLANPRHAFLPTFIDPNETIDAITDAPLPGTPYAYLPLLAASNTGLLCDVPTCPRYIHPGTGDPVPGTYPCGVDPTAMFATCIPCSPESNNSVCIASGGTGGVCDCGGVAWAAAHEDTPYWAPGTGAQPWAPSTDPRNPMCDPWCANDGVWSGEEEACICDATAFRGPRCDVPKCPRGTPAIGVPTNCSACPRGWDVATDCTSCAAGYMGSACASCAPGFFLDTSVPRDGAGTPLCTPCASVVATRCPAPGNSNSYTCDSRSGPLCVCALGYATPAGAPTGASCTSCAPGFTALGTGPGWRCVPCATALGCAPAPATKKGVCPGGSTSGGWCDCASPNMNPKCSGCASGYGALRGTCVPCVTALGCAPRGTLGATCTSSTSGTCVCNTTAGATGPKCASCAPGWVALPGDGPPCAPCGLTLPGGPCGPWGTLDCSVSPPTCACTGGTGGPACAACTACGPGGTCALNASATPLDPWCTCDPGWARNGTRPEAPCSLCALPGLAPLGPNASCVSIVALCGSGPGVDALGSIGAATGGARGVDACRCRPGFRGLGCATCAPGHAGPLCTPCPGTGTGEGTPPPGATDCTWDPVTGTPFWACGPGGAPPDCTQCLPGWAPGPPDGTGPCTPCGPCGRGGTCAPGPLCVCTPGFIAPSGPNTSCTTCAQGTSPITCSPCGPCAQGRLCAEPAPGTDTGTGTCVCAQGFRILQGLTEDPGLACFTQARATQLELAIADVDQRHLVSTSPTDAVVDWKHWTPREGNPMEDFWPFLASSTATLLAIVIVATAFYFKLAH